MHTDTSTTRTGLLVAFALGMSALSLYYYLQVLKQIYITEPGPERGPMATPVVSEVAVVLLAAAVVVLGCAPNLLLGPLTSAIQVTGP